MPTYTTKGFTGQYADAVTGLDYYNARYYDPVAGVFLSADMVQGNMQGMNPYGYVGGNPETNTDPTGKYYAPPGGPGGPTPPPPCNQSNNFCNTGNGNNPGGGTPPPHEQEEKAPVHLGGCDAACQQERLAYHDAQRARDYFQNIANDLTSKLFWLISTVFTMIGFFLQPFDGGIVAGFALGLAAVGNIAGDIASGFRAETDMVDLVENEKIGRGWFTKDTVTTSGNQILSGIGHDGLTYAALGLVAGITAFIAGASVAAVAPGLAEAVVPLIVGGMGAGVVAAAVVSIGTGYLYDQASNYIAQEESDAPCIQIC